MKFYIKHRTLGDLIKSFDAVVGETGSKRTYLLSELQHKVLQKAIQWGKQRPNVKYVRRFWKNDRWNYIYEEDLQHHVEHSPVTPDEPFHRNIPRQLKIDTLQSQGVDYEKKLIIGVDVEERAYSGAIRKKLAEHGIKLWYGKRAHSMEVPIAKLGKILTDPNEKITVKVNGQEKEYVFGDLVVMSDHAAELMQSYIDKGMCKWAQSVIDRARAADGEETIADLVAKQKERARNITYTSPKLQEPFNLHPYQADGAGFMLDKKSALIGYDVGLGKTLTAICAGKSVPNKRKVVVCPNAVEYNWKKEYAQYLGADDAEKTLVLPDSGKKSRTFLRNLIDTGEINKYDTIIMSQEWAGNKEAPRMDKSEETVLAIQDAVVKAATEGRLDFKNTDPSATGDKLALERTETAGHIVAMLTGHGSVKDAPFIPLEQRLKILEDYIATKDVSGLLGMVARASQDALGQSRQLTPAEIQQRRDAAHAQRRAAGETEEQIAAQPSTISDMTDKRLTGGQGLLAELIKDNVLILDEAHAYKNPQADRTKGLKEVLRQAKPEYNWMLTATPVPNRMEEAFTMLSHLIGEDELGRLFGKPNSATLERDWRAMLRKLGKAIKAGDKLTQRHIEQQLSEIASTIHKSFLKYSLAKTYTDEDVKAFLPAVTRDMPELKATPKQQIVLQSIIDEAALSFAGMQFDEKLDTIAKKCKFIIAKLTRLNQAGIDPSLVSGTYDNVRDGNAKFEYVRKVVNEHFAPNKHDGTGVVLFCDYKEAIPNLKEYLEKRGCHLKPEEIGIYSGDFNAKQKQQIVDDFNSGKIKFLMLTKAGEEGINLQKNCYKHIDLDIPWTPKSYAQREGRILRQGQKHQVMFFRPVMEHLGENRRAMALLRKLELNESILRADNFDKMAHGERIASDTALDLDDLAALAGIKIDTEVWKKKEKDGTATYNLGGKERVKKLTDYATMFGVGKTKSFNDELFNYSWTQFANAMKFPDRLHNLIRATNLKMFVRQKKVNMPISGASEGKYEAMYDPMTNRLALTQESTRPLAHEIAHFIAAKAPNGGAAQRSLFEAIRGSEVGREPAKDSIFEKMQERLLQTTGGAYTEYSMDEHELFARYFAQYVAVRRKELGEDTAPAMFIDMTTTDPLKAKGNNFTEDEFKQLRPVFEDAMSSLFGEEFFKAELPRLHILRKAGASLQGESAKMRGAAVGEVHQHSDGIYYKKLAAGKWQPLGRDKKKAEAHSSQALHGTQAEKTSSGVQVGHKVRISGGAKGSTGRGLMATVKEIISEGGKKLARLADEQGNYYRVPLMALEMAKSRNDDVKTTMTRELETGTKIEAEHDDVYDYLSKYIDKHGKLPDKAEFRKRIATDHVKGSKRESGDARYYVKLKGMEGMKDLKGTDKKIADVIRSKGARISDDDMHALADKLGISPHDLETRVYKLLGRVV